MIKSMNPKTTTPLTGANVVVISVFSVRSVANYTFYEAIKFK